MVLERQGKEVVENARQQARLLHWENRRRVGQIRANQLHVIESHTTRRRELIEHYSTDWIGPYADYLDRLRPDNYGLAGGTAMWQRNRGQNYPIFQSEQELALLRAPSRLLCATNSTAIGLVEGLTSYVIGTGYTYRAAGLDHRERLPPGLVASCQAVTDEFLLRNDWHGGEQPGIEEELFGRSIEDGEYFLAHFRQPDGSVDVRIIEPDQITLPPDADIREWGFGIRTDPNDTQKPLAYWVRFGDKGDGEEFTPEEMTHVRRNSRRSVKRGVPDFCFDTAETIRLASTLRSNLQNGATIQAAIVGIRQHQVASEQSIQAFVDNESEWLEPGRNGNDPKPSRRAAVGFEDIPSGLNYVAGPGANNASAHIAVLDACLRGAGVRWNAPEWLSTGSAGDVNYASSLTTESPFIKNVLRRQRMYRESFRRSAWLALMWAAECGRVHDDNGNVWRPMALKRVLEIVVEAPEPQTRNPQQDATVAAIEIPMGVDSRQQYAQRQGRDWDRVRADNQQYEEQAGHGGKPLALPGDTDDDGI